MLSAKGLHDVTGGKQEAHKGSHTQRHEEILCLSLGRRALAVKTARRLRRRDAGGEGELLVIDHLPLERHRQKHAQRRR